MTAGFYVERVLLASTADRCGALSVGKLLKYRKKRTKTGLVWNRRPTIGY